jgi:hypothetical protein
MINLIKRILVWFNIRYCIICGRYRYGAPFTLGGGSTCLCRKCLKRSK